MDRRVRRTRRLLKNAMMELIQEVGWERVTVEALAERADVGRSTFYAHYPSKEDLLFDGFEGWVDSVGVEDAAPSPYTEGSSGAAFPFSIHLLHHIQQQRRFFLATMVRSRNPRIRRRVVAMLVARVQADLQRMGRDATEASAHAIAGAFLEVVTWWLTDGRGTPIEEVDRAFRVAVGAAE